jgi:integrase
MARPGGADRGVFEKPAGSGKWYACWTEHGKTIKRLVGTKANARAYVDKKREEARLALLFPERADSRRRQLTVQQLVDRYQADWQRLATSRESDRDAAMWAEHFGGRLISDIRPSCIESWRSAKLRTCKPSTVNRYVSTLRRLFTRAIDDGLLATNPASSKALPKLKEEHSIKFLPLDQQDKLMAEFGAEMARAAEIAILMGLRASEQFGMLRESVLLEQRLLVVRKSKNGKPRYLPLSDRLVELFTAQLESHTFRWVWPGYESRTGLHDGRTHRTPVSANRALRRACERAGIPVLPWHALRHTFGTRAAPEGDIRTVQEFMGHSSVAVTQRYSHVSDDRMRSLVDRVSRTASKKRDETSLTSTSRQ